MNATGYRASVVSVANRRGGRTKIHRPTCRFVVKADPFYVRAVRTGDVSHRIYDLCKVCLADYSVFRMPSEPTEDVEVVMAACGRTDPHRGHRIYASRFCAGNLDLVTERTI